MDFTDYMLIYFKGEKHLGFFLIGLGIAVIILISLGFFFIRLSTKLKLSRLAGQRVFGLQPAKTHA